MNVIILCNIEHHTIAYHVMIALLSDYKQETSGYMLRLRYRRFAHPYYHVNLFVRCLYSATKALFPPHHPLTERLLYAVQLRARQISGKARTK